MYTFELAADKETKISCPSLLPADIKSTEDLSKAPLQQSEKPSGWMTPFNTPYPSLSPRSGQTGAQIPKFPQSLDLPSKPYQVTKGFDPSFFYSFFYPYSASPETTPTKPLHILTPAKPENTGEDFHFPINHLPVFLPMWPPVTKLPPPKHEVDQRQYQFNLSPKLSQKITEPPSSQPKGQEQGYPDQFSYTQTSPQTHSYPLYLEKLPKKPGKLHTSVSGKLQPEENLPLHLICNQIPASKFAGASQGQVSQPFYLLCTHLKLALNTASQQPHHKIPQDQEYHTFFLSCTQDTQASKPMSQPLYTESGQVYQSFDLLCTLLRQSSQPSGVTWAPQHEALQTYRYRAFFPYYAQSQPTSKPDVTQPPQPRTPQGQVYQQFFSFYTQSKPTPKPQQPVTPQGQSFQQFFQFFTQPQPTLKPADITQPPLPNTSPSQVYNPLLDYFYQLKQAHKPAVTPPPNPATPQGQAYQSLLDYLTQQNQTPKPDSQSPQSATPEDQIYQPIFHFHTPPKQTPKSAVTLPPLPATLQGQVHLPLLHYFSLKPTQKSDITPPPKPATPQGQAYQHLLDYFTQLKSTPKPAVTQPLQPSSPRSQAYQHSFHFPTKSKLTSIPTVSGPSDLDISQGLVNQPFFHFQKPELQMTSKPSDPLPESSHSQMYQLLHPYQLHTHPKPLKEPTLVSQPSQPAVLQGEAHQMCLYDQLLTESQLAKMPPEIILGKVYGPCQPSWKLGAETSSFLKPAAHVQPAYCSQFCPSGLSNCCLQIAFHQHLHISSGQDGKDVSHIHNRQPFSQAVYPDFSRGLEGGQIPQKLSEAAVLQSLKAPMAAHISPHRLPWAAGQNQEYFQPPDGNPATQARSSPIKTTKQSPVYPYFATDSSNPHWVFLPHSEVPNLGQRKSEGFNDPSKLWASGVKRLAPGEQRELDAINFPKQQNSQVLAEYTHSRPNFRSFINRHGSYTAEQQSKLDIEPSLRNSEFEDSTHHNLKHAIDNFFSPHYMPQDAPNSNRNSSEALNSQTHLNSNNSTKAEQAMNSDSRPESYVLLQHGPPNRKPIGFSDDSVDLRNQDHSPGHQRSNQNLKLLEGSLFETPEDEVPNPFLDDVDYMLRMDDKLDLPLFSSTLDDTGLVYLPPEQYFSAAQLKPEVLESFEDLWKSMTSSDSSQSFAAKGSSKRTSAADQTA